MAKAANGRFIAEPRDLAARMHVPGATAKASDASSALPRRPQLALRLRFANEPPEGFAATGPPHPHHLADGIHEGFVESVPRPPVQSYALRPSHPPPPPQRAYSRGPKLPRVEWLEEDADNRILARMPGAAAYYKKSPKFRLIKARGEEQVPGQDNKQTDKKSPVEEPRDLVVIFGRTNLRRATSNRMADARTQSHNKRA